LICFAALLFICNQSQVEALPARRFGPVAPQSNFRRFKAPRQVNIPGFHHSVEKRAEHTQPINLKFAKRSNSITANPQPVAPKQRHVRRQASEPVPCRNAVPVAARVKRDSDMQDAPAIYAANLPPAPTTGFWATATSNPSIQPVIEAIERFNNVAQILNGGINPKSKRQLVDGQTADPDLLAPTATTASLIPTIVNMALEVPNDQPTDGAIIRKLTQIETLLPTTVTLPQLDQNGYPMGPATTVVLYAPVSAGSPAAPSPDFAVGRATTVRSASSSTPTGPPSTNEAPFGTPTPEKPTSIEATSTSSASEAESTSDITTTLPNDSEAPQVDIPGEGPTVETDTLPDQSGEEGA